VTGDCVYLFVKFIPTDGMLRLPGAGHVQWQSAAVLASGKKLTLHSDEDDATIDFPPDSVSGFMPVIKLRYQGPLNVEERVLPAVPLTLDTSMAQKFYNYNGEGYEAPQTLYKLRWAIHSGCANLTFHAEGEGKIALVSNGSARPVDIREGAREDVTIGEDHTLELTPPQPFVKGTSLPLIVRSIEFSPHSCAR
jgi:alpha-L-fucosidase